jgi:hypothetical protein
MLCVWKLVSTRMDVGDGVALAAALITAVALWFAARSAKASEDSSSAAVRSAAASEEALRLAKAARDQADRPHFALSARYIRDELCHITIKMIGGPPQIEVTTQYIAESEGPDIPIPDGSGYARPVNLTAGNSNGPSLLVKDDEMVVLVKVQPGSVAGSVRVMVLCDETEGECRQWYDVQSVRWARPATRTTRAQPEIVLGPGIGTASKRFTDPRIADRPDAAPGGASSAGLGDD